ncbi:MAG: hypothetical protein PHC48_06960 [Prevotella sp.]|jgi:hypothetical protein|nr:hypothetical protein [Prevotella sp.]
MIYHIILLFLTLLIVVLTGCLYQNKSRKMLRFYDRMITFESFRKFYVLVLLLVLLVINFAQHQLSPSNWIVIVSSGFSLLLFRFKCADTLLLHLKDRPKLFYVVAILNIILMFTLNLNTLALPIACILMAALFYPSTKILNWTNNPDLIKQICEHREALAIHYF